MKKKIYFILVLCALCTFGLLGCKKMDDEVVKYGEGTSYSLVNKQYIGKCIVKTKNGVVEEVTYDEAFLPIVWSNIEYNVEETNEEDNVPDDIIKYTSEDDEISYFSKYVSIDGKVFTAEIRETDLTIDNILYKSQYIKYSNDEISDLFTYLYNDEENCKWYFEAVKNNDVYICDSEGNKIDTYNSLNTYGLLKSEGKYWTQTESSPIGWQGNIDNLINYLKGKTLENLDESKFVKDTEGEEKDDYNYQYWTIDGVKTQVTMTDVYEYYKLAYRAYNEAKTNEQ